LQLNTGISSKRTFIEPVISKKVETQGTTSVKTKLITYLGCISFIIKVGFQDGTAVKLACFFSKIIAIVC